MKPDIVLSKMRELAEKWFAGELSDKRFAEIIAGLLNAEVKQ
ncbi:MAG TPA: hypothetical protein VFD15_04490 [Clostridia bacterium]|nr:hypothetical protein [Clostridia bacterium]